VRIVLGIAVASLGCTAGDDIHTPSIASVNPTRATIGTSIVVSGSYFCAQVEPAVPDDIDPLACKNIGTVQFGSLPVSASQYTDTEITVPVPDVSPGSIQLRVSVSGRTSNQVSFTVE
jgi:hypothetical protein